MTREDFDELLSYCSVYDPKDMKILYKAGGELLNIRPIDMHMIAEALGAKDETVEEWFKGEECPYNIADRLYIIDWMVNRLDKKVETWYTRL